MRRTVPIIKVDSDAGFHLYQNEMCSCLALGKLTCSLLVFQQMGNCIRTSDISDLCFIHSDPATQAESRILNHSRTPARLEVGSHRALQTFNCSSESGTFDGQERMRKERRMQCIN